MSNPIYNLLSHLMNAGSFNEGQQDQVSADSLPPRVKQRVDQLADVRNSFVQINDPELHKQAIDLQMAINYLYNPRTRDQAMASWEQLHGDENNPWSATGGRLGPAARMVNQMTVDPEHNLYGGKRAGGPIPSGATVTTSVK